MNETSHSIRIYPLHITEFRKLDKLSRREMDSLAIGQKSHRDFSVFYERGMKD